VRDWSRAKKKVALGDSAEWIWNIADQNFVGAIQIVDLLNLNAGKVEIVMEPIHRLRRDRGRMQDRDRI
jgi:hypothetical protein